MNILFTCAGRRNYLINYFKDALKGDGLVLAADNQLTAPALIDADVAITVPSIYCEGYIGRLKEIIPMYQIDAIISLNDLELPILAKNKEGLEALGTKVIISDPKMVDIAFDKWKTFKFFNKIGVLTPKTYKSLENAQHAIARGELKFPLVVKPRWGSASISVEIVENAEELELVYRLQRIKVQRSILKKVSAKDSKGSILIQEMIGGTEYGIDILNDFQGRYYGSFARKKLGMRSGETDKAVSVIDPRFNAVARKIADNTGHLGNMDCDFFVHEDQIYYLEMNPRFGGGYPFSHEAGMDTPAVYIAWLKGETSVDRFNNYAEGRMYSKCDRLIQINAWEE